MKKTSLLKLLTKDVPFISHWKETIWVALISGVFIGLLQILLQPFDSYLSEDELKNLKLAGYALCVFLPIISWFLAEKIWFKVTNHRWLVYQEITSLCCLFLFVSVLAYIYHTYLFSSQGMSVKYGMQFILHFCLPFLPLLLPLIGYLRFTFGEIQDPAKPELPNTILLEGENYGDYLHITASQFVYAKAQQNYVSVFWLNNGELQEKVIRSTLTQVLKQTPFVHQVHRSYLVNLAFVKSQSGNSRKRLLHLNGVEMPIPITQKFYKLIEKRLQNQP